MKRTAIVSTTLQRLSKNFPRHIQNFPSFALRSTKTLPASTVPPRSNEKPLTPLSARGKGKILRSCHFNDPQEDDRPDDRDRETVDVESSDTGCPDQVHGDASDQSAHDAYDHVEKDALRRIGAHEEGSDPPRDTAENKKCNYSHSMCLAFKTVHKTAGRSMLANERCTLSEFWSNTKVIYLLVNSIELAKMAVPAAASIEG